MAYEDTYEDDPEAYSPTVIAYIPIVASAYTPDLFNYGDGEDMPQRWTVNVVIPNTAVPATLSPACDFGGGATYLGLSMSAAWTAGALSFQVSNTYAGTYYDLYDEAGAEVSIATPVAGTICALDALRPYLSQFRYVKVRSGASGAEVQQAAARTLTFIFER